jgi:hypothetical protein
VLLGIQKSNLNSNSNSFSSNLKSNTKMVNNYDSYSYIPKLIHDDDEVRRNINDQINFVNILIRAHI